MKSLFILFLWSVWLLSFSYELSTTTSSFLCLKNVGKDITPDSDQDKAAQQGNLRGTICTMLQVIAMVSSPTLIIPITFLFSVLISVRDMRIERSCFRRRAGSFFFLEHCRVFQAERAAIQEDIDLPLGRNGIFKAISIISYKWGNQLVVCA